MESLGFCSAKLNWAYKYIGQRSVRVVKAQEEITPDNIWGVSSCTPSNFFLHSITSFWKILSRIKVG